MANELLPHTDINPNANTLDKLKGLLAGKSVVYIASTYLDYLRVQQEIMILKKHAQHVYVIVSKQRSYLLRLIYVYFKTIFHTKKSDIAFIGFAPQLVLPFLKWRFFKHTIIIDFFIALHDTLVMDRKKFSPKSWMARLLMYIDCLTLKKSDFVICDTNQHADFFVNDLGCVRKKIHTLYLQADSRYYFPKLTDKPESLKSMFVVLYFGTALPLQGTDIIIDAINKIHNQHIFFILIGPLNTTKINNLNVQTLKWLEQTQLADYISFSDLCLAGHFNGEIAKAQRTIPGKAYIYEAMQKTMLLGENKANRERYPKIYEKVKFVEMGSAAALANAIEQCFQEDFNEKN